MTGTALTRRTLLRTSIALGGAYALVGQRQWRAAAKANTQKIRAAGFVESQEQLQATLAVLQRYQDLHPGIEISPEFTDYGSYTDKLATETAGGNAPDMLSANADIMGEYSRRGVLRPLDEYVPGSVDLTDYTSGTVTGNTIDGKLYGIPNDCISTALIYDTTVFAATGVPVPDQMWTWEQYEQTANAIAQAKGKDFFGTEDAGGSYTTCDMFFRSMGKEFYTADAKLGFEEQDLEQWFSFWQRLRESGGTPPGEVQALSTGDDLTQTGLIAGRAAILPQLTDTYFGLQSLTEHPLGIHMQPNGFNGGTLTQHHYTYAGNSTSISQATDHADTAIDIIRFMHVDPEGISIYYGGSGLVPASNTGRATLRANATAAETTVLDYIQSILDSSPADPRHPAIAGVSAILTRMNEEVAFGRKNPADAAKGFFSEASSKIR